MYGDCQVMSSMGGGGGGGGGGNNNNIVSAASLDHHHHHQHHSLFSSPIRNPNNNNYNFMSNSMMPNYHPYASIIPKEEVGLQMIIGNNKEDDMESGSADGSGHIHDQGGTNSADDELLLQETDQQQQNPKKKRYHRHTARQIQEMEALFKECPHPDDKQRMRLSQDLGLKPRQVKFWFQNRRTQMKAQQDRSDNIILRTENENLKNENYRLQTALRNVSCPNCGGPAILGEMSLDEQHLRLENARLKEELERLACIAPRFNVRQLDALGHVPHHLAPSLELDMGIYPRNFQELQLGNCGEMMLMPENQHDLQPGGCCLILDQEKPLAMEFAMNAMDELVKMCHAAEPLWIQCNNKELLNVEEYARMFPWPVMNNNHKQHKNDFRTEATRNDAVVFMNSVTLVDAFLDANKWMELFPSIVSRAKIVQIISTGAPGHASNSLLLMHAEFQVLSPLVPTREAQFLRYCQQNAEDGTWAIVDFPIDNFNADNILSSSIRYRRKPSGCIIKDMPNGYSRVTWVEHAQVEDKPVHQIFNQFVSSGMAFGAQRWLAVLQRQCERFASLMARNVDLGVLQSAESRKNLMNLSHRMMRTFCFNISCSGGQSWTAVSNSSIDTVRITTRKNVEAGQPTGLILCAVSTTWLPFSRQQVFEFLREERCKSQVDVLHGGISSEEVVHIASGSHPGNCISLLNIKITAASNSPQNSEVMLQESCTDSSGSMVVYTIVDINAINRTMNGEDPSYIPILPLGFVVNPANHINNNGANGPPSSDNQVNGPNSGCLLTVGLQVLASPVPGAMLNHDSAILINNHICNAVQQITAVLSSSNNNSSGSPDGCNTAGGSCAEPSATSE